MILNIPRREKGNRRAEEVAYALMQSRLNSFMPSPCLGEGVPVGHRGRTAQDVRHTRRGEGAPYIISYKEKKDESKNNCKNIW